jgi:hypothetical protein
MSAQALKFATRPISVQLSEPEFTTFILPHLSMPTRGPTYKLGRQAHLGSCRAPVVPEYSYHIRRTPIRVSREPTSSINRQAVRVTTVAVAAFDALISIQPGASLTTWSQTVRCRRVRTGPPGSTSGSATESSLCSAIIGSPCRKRVSARTAQAALVVKPRWTVALPRGIIARDHNFCLWGIP